MQNDPSQTSEADADGCSWLVAARVAMRTIVLGAALTIETVVSSAAFLPRQGVRIRVWPWLPNRGSAEPSERRAVSVSWVGSAYGDATVKMSVPARNASICPSILEANLLVGPAGSPSARKRAITPVADGAENDGP